MFLDQVQEKKDENGNELVDRLSEFGLSFDEASIFYLLVRIKKSGLDWISGKELALIAKRDRVRVYQILQKLEKLGLIRADFGRPTGYSVIPAEVAIERLVSIHEAKLHQLNSYQTQLKEALRKAEPIALSGQKKGDDEQNKPAMSMFHGVSGIQHLIRASLTGNSVRIIANQDSIEYILSTIERSPQKPKLCRVLVSGDGSKTTESYVMNNKKRFNFEISFIDGHLPTFILTDNQVLILFYTIEKYKPKPLSSTKSRLVMLHALVVGDRIYLEEMHELFETLWQISSRNQLEVPAATDNKSL